jgi:hypothetical protein
VPAGISLLADIGLWLGGFMADFRCYFTDADDKIVLAADIAAPDLESAIRQGFQMLKERQPIAPRPLRGLEIWQGARQLFSGRAEDSKP